MPNTNVSPPRKPAQVTVTSAAQSLQTLLGDAAPYPNIAGIQIQSLSGNAGSAFWGLAATATDSANSSEIPAGTAQVIPPALAPTTAQIYLIASGNETVCVVFLGG